MRAIIVDDEKNSREILSLLLNKIDSNITIVGEASGVDEAIALISCSDFDCLFLDIELINGTGFDILEAIDELNANLIFTTAYNDYALQALKENAIDYLLKPIDFEELKSAVKKSETRSGTPNLNVTLDKIKVSIYGKRIAIKSINAFDFVNSREILYIQSEGAYSTVFQNNGGKVTCTKSLRYFEKELVSEKFFRINKSELVNIEMISKFRKDIGHGQITLKNGDILLLSRRKKAEFIKQLLTD